MKNEIAYENMHICPMRRWFVDSSKMPAKGSLQAYIHLFLDRIGYEIYEDEDKGNTGYSMRMIYFPEDNEYCKLWVGYLTEVSGEI